MLTQCEEAPALICAERDADGKYRVEVTAEESRTLLRAAEILEAVGLEMLIRCQHQYVETRSGTLVLPRPRACGHILVKENARTLEAGAECICSRLYLTARSWS